jgi:alkyl hydroperoxide reductase subunit AhpC
MLHSESLKLQAPRRREVTFVSRALPILSRRLIVAREAPGVYPQASKHTYDAQSHTNQRLKSMALRINDEIPNLTVETDQGSFTLHDFVGDSWAILFSHPKDFTPVCTTEFGAVAQLAAEWEARGTKVIGVSVDGVEDHKNWKADIEAVGGAKAGFPIIADDELAVSKAFDMLPAEAYLPDGRTPADSATVRSVFIIGPDKKLKLTMTYPMTVGRNFAEVLRALDALQTSAKENVATPANWVPGQDVVVPMAVSDEDAIAKYGSIDTKLPYLRMAKLPG